MTTTPSRADRARQSAESTAPDESTPARPDQERPERPPGSTGGPAGGATTGPAPLAVFRAPGAAPTPPSPATPGTRPAPAGPGGQAAPPTSRPAPADPPSGQYPTVPPPTAHHSGQYPTVPPPTAHHSGQYPTVPPPTAQHSGQYPTVPPPTDQRGRQPGAVPPRPSQPSGQYPTVPAPTGQPSGQYPTVGSRQGQYPTAPPRTDQPSGQYPTVAPATEQRSGQFPTVAPAADQPSGQYPTVPPVTEQRSGQFPTVAPAADQRSGQFPTVPPRSAPPAPATPPPAARPTPPPTRPTSPAGPPPRPATAQSASTAAPSVGAPPAAPGRPATRPAAPGKPGKPAKQRKPVPQKQARAAGPVARNRTPKHKDRPAPVELAITEIAGHLTFSPTSVTAWYWLPEMRWAFRPDTEREAMIVAIAEQYAGLAGFRLHLRRTTKPFPADAWAQTINANTPHPLPTPPGAPTWSDHLVNAQRHLLQVNHAEGQTYLGITFARRTFKDNLAERLGALRGKGTGTAERKRVARMVGQFDEVLGAFGMRGRRVTPTELEWLIYRSVALCMDPPQLLSSVRQSEWERSDLLALTEQIERYRTPYGSTVKLVNRLTGEERHACVLTVGRMEPLEIPERHEPWMHFHERLPWPMEISSHVDVLGPGDTFRNLEHRLRMIRSQQSDYVEHGMDVPPELERLARRALVVGDDMTTGLPLDASRVHGWHRIAIGGSTREECLERARALTKLYSRDMRISLQHPKNQDWLAREFIPGEPIANTGYVRRMPVKLFAAALPQGASNVGDRRGDLIGRTAGTSRRPVFLDLHFPMEVRERSGLAVFVSEPGGGKSTLVGGLGYLAARRGVQTTLLDPSGPLARICEMPELKPYSRVLNLTGSQEGTLAPYGLIPTPMRSHFPAGPGGDREYEIGVSNARAERRMLVQDICSMLIPPQVTREASTAALLRHAARQVPAEETSTLDDVVKALRGADDDGVELANLLMDAAEMPLARLFFGKPPESLTDPEHRDVLTVITMAGLRLPDLKIEREYWSAEEQLALPMLHTAHRLAVRRCYSGDMNARKLVGLDEAHFMEGWRSGRSFLVRLARDSRKWNIAGLVASQNPKDILGLDVQNLVSTVFVGRIAEDPEIAAEALRLLRVPRGVGYEAILGTLSTGDTASDQRLSYREFVMRDVDARVQRMRVDLSYVPELLTYLDTTPTQAAPVEHTAVPAASREA